MSLTPEQQRAFLNADIPTNEPVLTALYVADVHPLRNGNIWYEDADDLTAFWINDFLPWLEGGGDEGGETWIPA
jgi:hypothetical protein